MDLQEKRIGGRLWLPDAFLASLPKPYIQHGEGFDVRGSAPQSMQTTQMGLGTLQPWGLAVRRANAGLDLASWFRPGWRQRFDSVVMGVRIEGSENGREGNTEHGVDGAGDAASSELKIVARKEEKIVALGHEVELHTSVAPWQILKTGVRVGNAIMRVEEEEE